MSWFVFALLSAFFAATYFALVKNYTSRYSVFSLAGGIFLGGSLLLAIPVAFQGVPVLGPEFFFSVLITVALNIVATFLYYTAFRSTDLSLAVPMLSLSPLFLIFTSFALLGELPSWWGVTGILLVVAGSYFLHLRPSSSFLEPFRSMLHHRGVLAMLAVAFLFSISSNFDKKVVLASDPLFSSMVIFFFHGAFFLIFSFVRPEKLPSPPVHIYLLAGLVLALTAFFNNLAYTSQIVPYVISVKRLSALVGVGYGALVFREPHVPQRLVGAALMVLGTVILVLA